MSIDTSGKWWVGSELMDVRGFLDAYAEEGYEVHEFRLCKCPCGSLHFQLHADDNKGVAMRICAKCRLEHYICGSDEYWGDAEPDQWKCVECNSEV